MRAAAVCVAVLVLASAAASAGRGSHWHPLRLPGRDASANAINDHGAIVGYVVTPGGHRRAVLWRHRTPQELGTLGGDESVATAINNRGQVVGWSLTKGSDTESMHAFLWEHGRMRDLGTVGGHRASEALAINDHGVVVGRTDESTGGLSRAWIWAKGAMRDLGTLHGGGSAGATGVNERGQVVGWSVVPDGSRHVFLYADGRMRDLGIETDENGAQIDNQGVVATASGKVWRSGRVRGLCTGVCSVFGMNDRGEMVGGLGDYANWMAGEGTAAVWSRGVVRSLDSGWTEENQSWANAINNHREIVGGASSGPSTKGGTDRAFLWTYSSS